MRASTEEEASRARAQPREGSTHLLQAHCLQRGCLVWRQERVCDRLLCLVEQSEDLLLQGSSGLLGQNRHSKTTMRKEPQEPMLPQTSPSLLMPLAGPRTSVSPCSWGSGHSPAHRSRAAAPSLPWGCPGTLPARAPQFLPGEGKETGLQATSSADRAASGKKQTAEVPG